MTITFEESRDNGYIEFYAISQLQVWKGKAYDELLWAEIRQMGDKIFRIVWEDNWQAPEYKESLAEAKHYILQTYNKHTPHINGTTFDIDEL